MPRYLAINYLKNYELDQRRSCFYLQTNYKKDFGNTSQNFDNEKRDCQAPLLYDSDLLDKTIVDEFLNNTIEDFESDGNSSETSDGDGGNYNDFQPQSSFQEISANKHMCKNKKISNTIANYEPIYNNLGVCYSDTKKSGRPNNLDSCFTKTDIKNILNDNIHQLVASYKMNEMKSGHNFGNNEELISQSDLHKGGSHSIYDFVGDDRNDIGDVRLFVDEFTNDVFESNDSSIEDFVIIDSVGDSNPKENDNSSNCVVDEVEHPRISSNIRHSEIQNLNAATIITATSKEVCDTNHDSPMFHEAPESLINEDRETSSLILIDNSFKNDHETSQQFKRDDRINDKSLAENRLQFNHKEVAVHGIHGDDPVITGGVTTKNCPSTDVELDETTNFNDTIRLKNDDRGDDDDAVRLLKSRAQFFNNISNNEINNPVPSLHGYACSTQNANINLNDISTETTKLTDTTKFTNKLITNDTRVHSNFNNSNNCGIEVDVIGEHAGEIFKPDEKVIINSLKTSSEEFVDMKIKNDLTVSDDGLKSTPNSIIFQEVFDQISVKETIDRAKHTSVKDVSIFVDEDTLPKEDNSEILIDVTIGDDHFVDVLYSSNKGDLNDECLNDIVESSKDGNKNGSVNEWEICDSQCILPESSEQILDFTLEELNKNKSSDNDVIKNNETCQPSVTPVLTPSLPQHMNIHEENDESLKGENIAIQPCNGNAIMENMQPVDLSFSNLTKHNDKSDSTNKITKLQNSNSTDEHVSDLLKNSSDCVDSKVTSEISEQTNENYPFRFSSEQSLKLPLKPLSLVPCFVTRNITASSSNNSSRIVEEASSNDSSTKVDDAESSMPIKRFVKLRDDFDHVDNFFNIRKRTSSNKTKLPVAATTMASSTSVVHAPQTMPPTPSSLSATIPSTLLRPPPPLSSSSASLILPMTATTQTKHQPLIVVQTSNNRSSITGNVAVVNPSFNKLNSTSDRTFDQTNKLICSPALLESLHNSNSQSVAPSIDVITVPLTGEHAKVADALGKQAEVSMSLLKGHKILNVGQRVEDLTPEMTRFIAKQFDRRNEGGDGNELLKASATLHLIVSALDSLVNCCLATAANQIKVMAERNRTIVGESLDEAVIFLRKLSDRFSRLGIVHPKVVKLLELLRSELGDGENVKMDKKVVIIIEMDYATSLGKYLQDCITSSLKGINVYFWAPVITGASEDLWETLKNMLSSHSVIISPSNILPLMNESPSTGLHCPMLVEYSYSNKNKVGIHGDAKMVGLKCTTNHEGDDVKVDAEGSSLENVLLTQNSYTLITSQEFIQLPDVLFSLESNYKITLIERSYSKMSRRMLRYCDVLIDHESGVLVDDISNLTNEESVERMVIRITGLSSNLKRCWVILYNFNGSQLSTKLLSNYYVLVAAGSMVTSKCFGYEIKFLCCNSLADIPPMIRQIADHIFRELIINSDDNDTNLFDNSFLTPDPMTHEKILIAFPCFNSMSAQMLLRSNSLKSLISSSLENLQKACPWLDPRFLRIFIKLRQSTSPMYEELRDNKNRFHGNQFAEFPDHANKRSFDETINDGISNCFDMENFDGIVTMGEENKFVMNLTGESHPSETPVDKFRWDDDDRFLQVKKLNRINKKLPTFGYMNTDDSIYGNNFLENSMDRCNEEQDYYVERNKYNYLGAASDNDKPLRNKPSARSCRRMNSLNYNAMIRSMRGSSGGRASLEHEVPVQDETKNHIACDRKELFHERNENKFVDFDHSHATSFRVENTRVNNEMERFDSLHGDRFLLDVYNEPREMNWSSLGEHDNHKHKLFSNKRKYPSNSIDHGCDHIVSGYRELDQIFIRGNRNEYRINNNNNNSMHSLSSSSFGGCHGKRTRKLTYEFDNSLKHGQTRLKFV